MLTIHTLGHVYITLAGKTIPVSAKALALITYLYLEKLPQHRERLADLLWNTPLSRKNLRVELARIRSAGLNIFPSSHQLLQLDGATSDLEPWCAQFNQNMNQSQLTAALATLRGIPLTGLEDLGGSTFQTWVDQQRWLLIQQVEHHLSRAYWRYARENQTWATRLISERAKALGLENPADAQPETSDDPLPVPTQVDLTETAVISHRIRAIHFERPAEEAALQQAFRRAAEHSQLILLHGPSGSGKSYLSERVARQLGWHLVRVPSLRSCRFVLAGVAQALLTCCDPQDVPALESVLLHPASLEEDVVKVGYALSRVPKQVMLLFDQAQDAPADLVPLMEFLFQAAGSSQRIFLIIGRDRPVHVPLARALLHRIERSASLELELSPLSNLSVQRALEGQFPFEPKQRLRVYAARLLQRSDGNPLHLLSLIDQAPTFEAVYTLSLPQSLRDSYDSEIDACPPELQQALKQLSVIYGRFDRRVAGAVLSDLSTSQVDALLEQAVRRRLLIEADPEVPVIWLRGVTEAATSQLTEFVFHSEGLRMTITTPLTVSLRQEVRRRLMLAYTDLLPGHAAYYARRAHLLEDAARLERVYRQQLPVDSPLLLLYSHELQPRFDGSAMTQTALAPEPETQIDTSRDRGLSRQTYSVFRQGSELSIVSSNRYGLPSTIRIEFPLPDSNLPGLGLQLRWRLDLYRGGEELGPTRAPFPLRLSALGSLAAHVLTPGGVGQYTEDGTVHQLHGEVMAGGWSEHCFQLTAQEFAARTLELSVRAVDVVLTIAELRWHGQSLLHDHSVSVIVPALP